MYDPHPPGSFILSPSLLSCRCQRSSHAPLPSSGNFFWLERKRKETELMRTIAKVQNFNQSFTTWKGMWTRVVFNRLIFLSVFSRGPCLSMSVITIHHSIQIIPQTIWRRRVGRCWYFLTVQSTPVTSPSITPRCKLKWYNTKDHDKCLFVLSVGPTFPSRSVTREYWYSSDSLFRRRAHTHPRVPTAFWLSLLL